MITFKQLGLSAPSLQALDAEGYTVPTDIQREAIPHGLAGRDVIGLARTGTGKTAAFALPIIERLMATRTPIAPTACRTLVVAPTRELAAQIAEGFRTYGRFTRLSVTVVFGGTAIGRQIHALARGVDVLVATPGRLLDLVQARACRLDAVEILVLDEADHMLDLGFIQPLRKIARMLPARRQTLFFSATMPPSIAELAAAFLRDPVRIEVASAAPAERVEQGVIHVDGTLKQALLEAILHDATIRRALVFTRTKHGADRVVKRLAAARIPAQAIHGNKSQPQRERALQAFKDGRARILVATEIAARGIDVDAVSHVINFDLPDVPEQYVHRIGRTARAGAAGVAVSFCTPGERGALRAIERLTRQSVRVIQHPVAQRPTPRPASYPASVRSPWRGRAARNGRAARL